MLITSHAKYIRNNKPARAWYIS